MTTTKILIIAIALGVLISTALLVMEALTDHAIVWLAWQMPGINAADLFRGAVGGSVLLGIAICWLVNAAVYGAAGFAVLMTIQLLTVAPAK
jgi:hypothetical protein